MCNDRFRKPIVHSHKRRAKWHDYSEPGTYLLTLSVEGRKSVFGNIVDGGQPHIRYTRLGQEVLETEIAKISHFYPNVEVWYRVLMPDHIHLIVRVTEAFAEKKSLGNVVRGFKTGCTRAWWRLNHWQPGGKAPGTVADNTPLVSFARGVYRQQHAVSSATVLGAFPPSNQKLPLLFEEGYNDRILLDNGQLSRWKRYIDDNPRRLAIKRRYPDLFSILCSTELCGLKCQTIGNRFLLDLPDKMYVVVHRADSTECFNQNMAKWMSCGERGGVLIGAFISEREKQVFNMANENGYNIVHVLNTGFPQYYKPCGEAFDACAEGRLLQISPNEYAYQKHTITRSECLRLNELARKLAEL